MKAPLGRAMRRAPWLLAAFLAMVALTLWFGGRVAVQAVYWSDPAHRQQDIEGWMTLGYIGQSWDVPPDVLAQALKVTPRGAGGSKPPPLKDIARDRGVPLETLVAQLEAAIAAHRAQAPETP